jgi:hypothetical protein
MRTTVLALFATIAALCVASVVAMASTNPLPWSVTAGKPTIIIGKEVAYFVWHVDNEVYVAVTNMNPKGDSFTGTITVNDGVISDPQGVDLELGDSITQVNSQELKFSFKTYRGLDELKFSMDRAVSQVNIKLEKDGADASAIYAGEDNLQISGAEGPDGYIHCIIRPDDDTPYDWSLTAGMPTFTVGTKNAYYVWHDSKYVYVVCTGDSSTIQYFDGEIRLHTGPITNITAMNDDSTYKLLDSNRMRWYFRTADGETGVRFQIDPTATLIGFTFHLDGLYIQHVYFGASKIEVPRDSDDTVVFNLSK